MTLCINSNLPANNLLLIKLTSQYMTPNNDVCTHHWIWILWIYTILFQITVNNDESLCQNSGTCTDNLILIKCDAIKQNESELRKNEISVFIYSVCFNFRAIFMLKPPSNLDIQIQSYSHFSDAQNNKMQRKFNAIIGSI